MKLLTKNEQGQVTDYFNEKLSIDLIESFISFILSESDEDIKFIKTLPLIDHVDPYADTYINSTQAPMYIKEFQKVFKYTNDKNLKKYCEFVINELIKLPRSTFLVLFGD